MKFINKEKEAVTLSKDKIVVLDFWSTYCGICYEKFPLFEKMYQKYKDNPNVEFYAIHVSYERDKFEKVIKLLDKYDYNFPLIYSLDSESVEDDLEVKYFPTTILIKNNVVRYKGVLVTNKNVIIGNTIRQLESLLNE
jgi:thiol-disulfide isomerase/thioredoxin